MPKKQKRPAKFKFFPFSEKQKKLMHWWRPGLHECESGFLHCGWGDSVPEKRLL